jgi:hypothetical protein
MLLIWSKSLKGQTKRFPVIYWTWLLEVGVARSVTDGRLALTGVHVLNWILDILGDLRVVVVVMAGMASFSQNVNHTSH